MPQYQQVLRMQTINQQQTISQLNQMTAPQQQLFLQQPNSSDGVGIRDRKKIWSGVLEWNEKTKPDQTKIARQVPCHVTMIIKDGEPEIRAENWPPNLFLQLIPKHLVDNIGGQYLKDPKMVVFCPNPCEAVDSLSKVMMTGFAGCVHFPTQSPMPSCEIKILILAYTAKKNLFLGFIPNNQTIFVDRLRQVILQKQALGQQGPAVSMQQQAHQSQQQQALHNAAMVGNNIIISNPLQQQHQANQQQAIEVQYAQMSVQMQNLGFGSGVEHNMGIAQQQQGQTTVHQPSSSSDATGIRDREKIWSGLLEWIEKTKPGQTKLTHQVPCHVTTNIKDGEPEIRAENWPPKLLMQLMPKHLVGNIGGQYLKDPKMVIFCPNPCEAVDSLSKVMTTGFAGCVHFSTQSPMPSCEIKVLILVYMAKKNAFLGFIPNNQTMFVDRLRKFILQKQTMGQQGSAVNMQELAHQKVPHNTAMVGNNIQASNSLQQQHQANQQQGIEVQMLDQQQQQHYNQYAQMSVQMQNLGLGIVVQHNMGIAQEQQPHMSRQYELTAINTPNMGGPAHIQNRTNQFDDQNFEFLQM